MKTRIWIIAAIVVLALVAVIALVPAVFAQGPRNGNDFGYGNGPMFGNNFGFGRQMGPGAMSSPGFNGNFGSGSRMGRGPGLGSGFAAGPMGRGGAWGGPENSLIAVTASVLEIDRAELIAQLQEGKTLAEVITEQGVAVDTVIDAFLAPRAEVLAQRVADGQLTQEQADAMLVAMKAHVSEEVNEEWSPRGPRGGNGPGFVDEDGDGVCDNCGAGRGRGQGYGPGFVDEDGDGVCDNYGSNGPAGRAGRMMGRWTR